MYGTNTRRVLGRHAAWLVVSLACFGTTAADAQTASRYPDKPITWTLSSSSVPRA